MAKTKKLGELLLEYNIIDDKQLQEALAIQKKIKKRIGDTLKDLGYITQEQINWIVTKQFNIPYVNISKDEFNSSLLEEFPYFILKEKDIVPVFKEEHIYHFAVSDPTEEETKKIIEKLTDGNYKLCLLETEKIRELLSFHYPYFPDICYSISELQTHGYEYLKFGFKDEKTFLYLSNMALSYPDYTLFIYKDDNRKIMVRGINSIEEKDLFQIKIADKWEYIFEKIPQNKVWVFDENKLFVVNFYRGFYDREPSIIVKTKIIPLPPIEKFVAFEKFLYENQEKFNEIKNILSNTNLFVGLIIFEIFRKSLFKNKVFVNLLSVNMNFAKLLNPYDEFDKHIIKSFPILTDKHIDEGNKVFFINHQNNFNVPKEGWLLVRLNQKNEIEIKKY